MTIREIEERALNKSAFSAELLAWDEARYQVQKTFGRLDSDDEIIEKAESLNLSFDKSGNMHLYSDELSETLGRSGEIILKLGA